MSKISVVNLSSYTTPKVVEYRNKDYVSYGDDNNYFKYLIDRYNDSPTTVSYTHLRAHETDSYLVCRLLLEKKKKTN